MPDPARLTLSATEVPALFGASPYITRWMLLRRFIHGDDISGPEHNRMDWGTKLQPLILAQAAEDLHLEVRPNATDQYVRRGLLGCTRDAEIICPDRGPGTLECKAVFDYGVWARDWSGGKAVPRHIEIQMQQQMLVGDGDDAPLYQWGVIAVWVCGEMHYFDRKPISDLWEAINNEALRFFSDVYGKHEGDPFGHPVEVPLLNRLFAPKAGTTLDLTAHPKAAEFVSQAQLMRYHATERAAHEKAEKAIKALFKATLGEAEEATLPGGVRIRQKQQSRAGYSVKPTTFTTIEAFVPENAPHPTAPADNILAGG
jgi:predicted phage-related endonuclease